MNKVLSIFTISFLLISSLSAQDLTQYEGCYKSLTFNGNVIVHGPDEKESMSYIDIEKYSYEFQRIDKTEIKSINLDIFTCFDSACPAPYYPNAYLALVESIFLNIGKVTYFPEGLSFQFKGDLFSTPWNSNTYLESKISIEKISSDKIEVKAYRKNSIAGPDYDRDYIWVLQRTKCL